MNQSYVCEQVMLAVCMENDMVTSQILAELADVPVTIASAYLATSAKAERLELVGKMVNPKNIKARHVYVYRVTSKFFCTRMSVNPKISLTTTGGVAGRTWISKELPLVEIDGGY